MKVIWQFIESFLAVLLNLWLDRITYTFYESLVAVLLNLWLDRITCTFYESFAGSLVLRLGILGFQAVAGLMEKSLIRGWLKQ
jgi:hypothetical protein